MLISISDEYSPLKTKVHEVKATSTFEINTSEKKLNGEILPALDSINIRTS